MVTLQCCVNGSRDVDEHPDVALTAEQCAREASAAVAAGADDLHIHPRTRDGRDSVRPADVAAWVEAVRAVVDVPVGVTTGAWAWAGGRSVAQAVGSWTVLPDHASVNWHESGADQVCAALVDRGVALHAGLWTVEAAESWLDSPWREWTDRVLVELPDAEGQVPPAEQILDVVLSTEVPVLLHGEDRSAWPVLKLARERDLATRVGFEDTVLLPDGSLAPDIASLVTAALASR